MKITSTVPIVALTFLLSGCPIEGDDGRSGTDGINCWDLNENAIDDSDEDTNGDGLYTVEDCQPNPAVSQSTGVDLNHQHICEALANLGQHPEGCPSPTHTTPTGTLTPMTSGPSGTFFDDGMGGKLSCGDAPSNGPLSVETRGDKAYWILEGGFIAEKERLSLIEADNGACQALCVNDPKCIAAFGLRENSGSVDCNTFYQSDTLGDWERFCSVDVPGLLDAADACIEAGVDQRWHVRCP